MKAYLDSQMPSRIAPKLDSEPSKPPVKAYLLDLYNYNLLIDCYQFCQQCEDYFGTAGVKKLNQISFAAFFLRASISYQCLQHKQNYNKAVLLIWSKFKDFFQKNLRDSRAFVNSIWKKVKCNSKYQDRSVQDWAAYLKYLEFVLIILTLNMP